MPNRYCTVPTLFICRSADAVMRGLLHLYKLDYKNVAIIRVRERERDQLYFKCSFQAFSTHASTQSPYLQLPLNLPYPYYYCGLICSTRSSCSKNNQRGTRQLFSSNYILFSSYLSTSPATPDPTLLSNHSLPCSFSTVETSKFYLNPFLRAAWQQENNPLSNYPM